MTGQPLDPSIERLLRESTPQVLGIVARRFRDFAGRRTPFRKRPLLHHYLAAAGKTGSLPERNYLLAQAARLSTQP